jgi:hypothetical protein
VVLFAVVDSENNQSPPIELSNNIIWFNNLGVNIGWVNFLNNPIGWAAAQSAGSGYFLYKSDAKMYGKYLGMTITSTATPFTINGFEFEHELRARF